MIEYENDPVIGSLLDTPEKKAKWIMRIKIAYILWIIFLTVGVLSFLLLNFFF
jgi:hypothetical protein